MTEQAGCTSAWSMSARRSWRVPTPVIRRPCGRPWQLHKALVDVDRWIPVHGSVLTDIIPVGADILLDPTGAASFRLRTDTLRSAATHEPSRDTQRAGHRQRRAGGYITSLTALATGVASTTGIPRLPSKATTMHDIASHSEKGGSSSGLSLHLWHKIRTTCHIHCYPAASAQIADLYGGSDSATLCVASVRRCSYRSSVPGCVRPEPRHQRRSVYRRRDGRPLSGLAAGAPVPATPRPCLAWLPSLGRTTPSPR